jgi:hypothetical protein
MRQAVLAVGRPVHGLTDIPAFRRQDFQGLSGDDLQREIAAHLAIIKDYFDTSKDAFTTIRFDNFAGYAPGPPETGVLIANVAHPWNFIVSAFSGGGIGVFFSETIVNQPDLVFGGLDPIDQCNLPLMRLRRFKIKNLNASLLANGVLHFCFKHGV